MRTSVIVLLLIAVIILNVVEARRASKEGTFRVASDAFQRKVNKDSLLQYRERFTIRKDVAVLSEIFGLKEKAWYDGCVKNDCKNLTRSQCEAKCKAYARCAMTTCHGEGGACMYYNCTPWIPKK
jgi:hypothetical protein